MKSKESSFADCVNRVQSCARCSRMENRKRILGSANGNLNSRIMFIAEAPGRLGADKYGIPLYGDQTGRNFEELLCIAGIIRESVFITNAILCNPRNGRENNDSPKISEIRNCSVFLKETLEIIKPEYVVPLGSTALTSLALIHWHNIKLSESAGKLYSWNSSKLFPLYHPSPRARIWRNKELQAGDFIKLAELISC